MNKNLVFFFKFHKIKVFQKFYSSEKWDNLYYRQRVMVFVDFIGEIKDSKVFSTDFGCHYVSFSKKVSLLIFEILLEIGLEWARIAYFKLYFFYIWWIQFSSHFCGQKERFLLIHDDISSKKENVKMIVSDGFQRLRSSFLTCTHHQSALEQHQC